jgi:hypothetical protein
MLTHTHTHTFYKLSMPEKNVTLSMHKVSWNFRSKLNFVQCFRQIDTFTHLECTLKKNKKLKLYPEGYPVEWWMMHPLFCESHSLEPNFCYLCLNLSFGYLPGKAQPP